MTPRQENIFKALKYAYNHARYLLEEEGKEEVEKVFEDYIKAANNDKLTSIQDIATLFFLGMAKYGNL